MTIVSTDLCHKGCRWPLPLCRKTNCPLRINQQITSQPVEVAPADDRLSLFAGLHLALAFMTRLPMPRLGLLPAGSLAGCMWLFPVVGVVIGLIGGAVLAGAQSLLPATLAAILAVAATALATGAMHEDGLADVADGFGGGSDRDRKLAIMKDSRIGSYGVLAVALGLALRIGSLASLAGAGSALGALVAAHALSRGAIPLLMQVLEPARENGLGASAGRPSMTVTGIAATSALLIAALALPVGAAVTAVAASLVALPAVAWLAWRQIGGYTGDVLGALQQVIETTVLLAVVAAR